MTGTKARVRPNLASGVPGVGVMRDGAVRPSLGSRQPTSPWPVEEGMLVNCSPSRIGGPTSFANRLDPLLREGPHHPSHTHLLKASLTKGSRVQLGAQWALGDGNLRTEGSVVWGLPRAPVQATGAARSYVTVTTSAAVRAGGTEQRHLLPAATCSDAPSHLSSGTPGTVFKERRQEEGLSCALPPPPSPALEADPADPRPRVGESRRHCFSVLAAF